MHIRKFLFHTIFLSLFALTIASEALAAPTVPQIASGAGREIDRQVSERLGIYEGLNGLTLFVTTPANIDNLDEANTLARQMQEEMSRWFTQKGYSVMEIRRSDAVYFNQETGELILTRDTNKLASTRADAAAVLLGNYTVTPRNVRFNLKLVQLSSNEVLGMSTVSLPMTSEISALLKTPSGIGGIPMEPTVITRLP